MAFTIWTDDRLNALRHIGDPPMDSLVERSLLEAGKNHEVTSLRRTIQLVGREGFAMLRDPDALARYIDRPVGRGGPDAEETRKATDRFLQEFARNLTGVWKAAVPSGLCHLEDVDIAQELFLEYGFEIGCSLLCSSLPNAYSAEAGARVLTLTGELQSHARRRIAETASFLIRIMTNQDPSESVDKDWPPFARDSPAFLAAVETRIFHGLVRALVARESGWKSSEHIHGSIQLGVPINAEDQLGTLLTFSVTVFEVLERLGIQLTGKQQAAYLHHWDIVGYLLGVGGQGSNESFPSAATERKCRDHARLEQDRPLDLISSLEMLDKGGGGSVDILDEIRPFYPYGLRPQSVGEAERLLYKIRDRHWKIPDRTTGLIGSTDWPAPAGRQLIRPLLDELESAMPPAEQRLPLAVMRYLADERVEEILALGSGGLPLYVLEKLPARRTPGAHRSSVQTPNLFTANVMRLAANEVARRALIYFRDNRRSERGGFTRGWDGKPLDEAPPAERRRGKPVHLPE